jgi:hypothetical protein
MRRWPLNETKHRSRLRQVMKKGKEHGLPARIGEESGQDARAPFVKRKLVSLFFLTLIISAGSVLAAEAQYRFHPRR